LKGNTDFYIYDLIIPLLSLLLREPILFGKTDVAIVLLTAC